MNSERSWTTRNWIRSSYLDTGIIKEIVFKDSNGTFSCLCSGFDHSQAIPCTCKYSSSPQDKFPPRQPWKSFNGWFITPETKAQLWSYIIVQITLVKRIKTLEGLPLCRPQLSSIVCWQDDYAATWSVHEQKLLLSGSIAGNIKTQLQDSRATVNNL